MRTTESEKGGSSDLALFEAVLARDATAYKLDPSYTKWLFADRLKERKERDWMNFYGFDGPPHLVSFFKWLTGFRFVDYFPAGVSDQLIAISFERDQFCLSKLGLSVPATSVHAVATYNSQDYMLQRFYPVPDRQHPRRILDFGAGHGRMANLAFAAPNAETELMVSVDAIPSSYLTQRVYYRGLGLKVSDYIEFGPNGTSFDFYASASSSQLLHLPTWRMDLLPDNYFDLICCVQVLKELPRRLVFYVLREFARTLKPGGGLYIRDHLQFHSPNQMPIDELLPISNFNLEFRPAVKDRVELHGLPQIWRKHDPNLLLTADD